MKLTITNGYEIDIKEGDVVLSPLTGHNIFDIDEYAANSEFEEVIVKTISQIPVKVMAQVLSQYAKKVRKNGRISIHGTDLYLVCRSIATRDISLKDANDLLFGGPEVSTMNCSMVGINDIVSHIEELGFKIEKKTFFGFNFLVEGVRV
jgi:hypothetical protein